MSKPLHGLDDCINGGPACPSDLLCQCRRKLLNVNEDLPSRMPPRPTPIAIATKVPRVFSIWGTIIYGISAITSIATVLIVGIADWSPPWWLTEPAFLYCFISAGIITLGRIESNRDARVFTRLLRQKSEENKRRMN